MRWLASCWWTPRTRTRRCGDLEAIEADIAQPGPPAGLGDLPLTVLSSGTGASIEDGFDVDGVTEGDLAEATRVMAGLQRELAALSTNSTQHFIADAGHYVHWDDPDAVIDAIDDAIETWRATHRPTP